MAIRVQNIISKYSFYEPIYQNLYEANFDDIYLKENCHKITNKKIHFNLNRVDDNKIEPLETINKLISQKTKFNLSIYLYDKIGDVVQIILLSNFQFKKIVDFLNLSWGKNDILDLKVKYSYEKMKFFNTDNDYKKYSRKIKIQQLNKLEF